VGVHLYRINVEFPAAVWSVLVTLSEPPQVGDSIDVNGTPCVVREVQEVQPRAGDGVDTQSVVANVYAEPLGADAQP